MVIESIQGALEKLKNANAKYIMLHQHGTMSFEIFKPEIRDTQQPHEQDEIYIIALGTATFDYEGEIQDVKQGDFLFVPAGKEHRFMKFSNDFSTWVIFYGPRGGEKNK